MQNLQAFDLLALLIIAVGIFIGGAYFGRKNPKFLQALDNGYHKLTGKFKKK